MTYLKPLLGLLILAVPLGLFLRVFTKKRLPKAEDHRVDRWKELGGA
jgi:hypothetical protein